MSVGSITAKNAYLDATYGSSAALGAGVPSAWYLAFFNGDPVAGGTELTSTGGYQRIMIANTNAVWRVASAGQKKNAVDIQATPSSGAYSAQITHVAFMDDPNTGNMWDTGALTTPLTVTDPNTMVRFRADNVVITVT